MPETPAETNFATRPPQTAPLQSHVQTTGTNSGTPWSVAWVTGASSGIGMAVAMQLARSGVVVAVSARSADKLSALAATHANLRAFPLDVTDRSAVATTVQRICGAYCSINEATNSALGRS